MKERERVPCVIKDVRATNSKNILSVHTLPLRSTTPLRDAATLSRIEDARGAAVRAATVRTVVTRIAHLALRADAEALPAVRRGRGRFGFCASSLTRDCPSALQLPRRSSSSRVFLALLTSSRAASRYSRTARADRDVQNSLQLADSLELQ